MCHGIQFIATSSQTYFKGSTCRSDGQLKFALTRKRTKYIDRNFCQQWPLLLELIFALPISMIQEVTLFHVSKTAEKSSLFVMVVS